MKTLPLPRVPADGTWSSMKANCRSQIGFVEGSNNDNPYAAICGHANHRAWCQTYLCAMAKLSGLKLPANTASTLAMAEAFKEMGAWGHASKPGAFGFIFIVGLGRIGHVYAVETIAPDGRDITFEGNTDVKGGRTGGRVMRHYRGARVGYGYPDYAPEKAKVLKPKPARVLKFGMGPAQDILNVQKALIKIAPSNARIIKLNGIMDKGTVEVVRIFQKHRGISPTGEVDLRTLQRIRDEIGH